MSKMISLIIIINTIIILGISFLFPPIALPVLGFLLFAALIILLPVGVVLFKPSFSSQLNVSLQHFISILLLLLLIPLEFLWGYISFGLYWGPSQSTNFIKGALMNMGNLVAFVLLFSISTLAFKFYRNAETNRQAKSGINIVSILNVIIGVAVIGFYLFWLIVVCLLGVNI